MRNLFLIVALLISSQIFASEETKHMVTISTSGVGASGAYEEVNPVGSSLFRDFDFLRGDIAINYTYSLDSRFQLGAIIRNESDERHFKTAAGEDGEIEYKTLYIGAMLLYNFADDLKNAYYTGVIVSHLNHEEEFNNKKVFNYLEDDRNAETVEILIGKRFSLKKWNLDNISYSPSASVFFSSATKDYKDDGIQTSWGVAVEAVKFDVLF